MRRGVPREQQKVPVDKQYCPMLLYLMPQEMRLEDLLQAGPLGRVKHPDRREARLVLGLKFPLSCRVRCLAGLISFPNGKVPG